MEKSQKLVGVGARTQIARASLAVARTRRVRRLTVTAAPAAGVLDSNREQGRRKKHQPATTKQQVVVADWTSE